MYRDDTLITFVVFEHNGATISKDILPINFINTKTCTFSPRINQLNNSDSLLSVPSKMSIYWKHTISLRGLFNRNTF